MQRSVSNNAKSTDVAAIVQGVVAYALGIPDEDVQLCVGLRDDLGAFPEDLDLIAELVGLRTGVTVQPAEMPLCVTPADIVDLVSAVSPGLSRPG